MGQRLYDDRSGQPERPLRAAEYVRMSTDHQKYSTENQSDAIKQYAEARGIEIVRTYADAGKSGLKIEGRDALRQLIEDVQSGSTDFTLVLVYDVSRWGRFQDADESAYYEYICRRAGIAVEYCAEQFDNDGSPISTIVKGVKRAMAGEYSRELSTKVFAGQGRLIEKGFHLLDVDYHRRHRRRHIQFSLECPRVSSRFGVIAARGDEPVGGDGRRSI